MIIKAAFIFVLVSVSSNKSIDTLTLPGEEDGGYILALKVVQHPIWGNKSYNHASLFKVGLDGSISKWWNVSFNENIGHISYGALAFDNVHNIVYLPTIGRITGVNQDGIITTNTHLQTKYQFWNYFYEPRSNTLIGTCSDATQTSKDDPIWHWCIINIANGTLSHNTAKLPYTDGPNGLDMYNPLYSVDLKHQIIWYGPYAQPFIVAANYMTGELVFTSGNTGASCIVYSELNDKPYIITGDSFSQLYDLSVYELLPHPAPPKHLIKLPRDNSFIIATFGSCGIIQESNTLYVFMTNITKTLSIYNDSLMPTDLILADLTNLSYKQVSLDIGDNTSGWNSVDILTGSIYVQQN